MLIPYRAPLTIQVDVDHPFECVVERQVSALPLLWPVLTIYNTEVLRPARGYDAQVSLEWMLDLGNGLDIIHSGVFRKILTTRVVPPEGLYVHRFDDNFGIYNDGLYPVIQHTLRVTTEAASRQIVLHGVISAVWEQTILPYGRAT